MIINPYRFAAGGGIQKPLHWWDLDSLTAGIADQGEGTTFNMTANGTPTVVGTGPNSQNVLDFDFGDYLAAGNQSWDGAGDSITVAIWANLDSLDSNGTELVSWRSNTTPNLFSLLAGDYATDYVFAQLWDDGQDQVNTFGDTDATIPFNEWHHYAFTWDGTTMRVYKDGAETATATNAAVGSPLETTAVAFQIGRRSSRTDVDTDGKLTMCGVWDTVLTADEISTNLYNGGNGNFYSDIWT